MNLELFSLFIFLMLSFLISIIISSVSFLLSQRNPNKEKVSVYECGFDPFHNPGEPFSIRFFLIAILFLVFDLEISYLFPWSLSSFLIDYVGQAFLILFLLILIWGLVYEWMKGGLEWE
uniref:NADH-ubiquinone oxidoreductase chain 3 n=1 Tax=Millepora sp. EK-2011 TaxID=1104536 RepID=G9ISP8_9CNID|nr:NADH dehydrogenase subunit 3 [Millepora sp. EK-2011]